MKITYIGHSGFSVELPSATLLFDYYTGTIPAFDPLKPLFVFSSHQHQDHFNPEVFRLTEACPLTHFIFSRDIWTSRRKYLKSGVSDEAMESAIYLKAHEEQSFPCGDTVLTVRTLRSTDLGVAFIAECDGMRIYHAGDLNWWLWDGDSKQDAGNMTANFQREIDTLSGISLDVAFVPLDPRQEEYYALGINYFLETVQPRHIFPMHFWEKYEVISRYQTQFPIKTDSVQFHTIRYPGESWILD